MTEELLDLVKTPNILEMLSLRTYLSESERFVYLLLTQFSEDEIVKNIKSISNIREFLENLDTINSILDNDILLVDVRGIKTYFNYGNVYLQLGRITTNLENSDYNEFIYIEDVENETLLSSSLLGKVEGWRDFDVEGIETHKLPNFVRFKLFLLSHYIPLKYESHQRVFSEEIFIISFSNFEVVHPNFNLNELENNINFYDGSNFYFKVGNKNYRYNELDKMLKENKHLLHPKYQTCKSN